MFVENGVKNGNNDCKVRVNGNAFEFVNLMSRNTTRSHAVVAVGKTSSSSDIVIER